MSLSEEMIKMAAPYLQMEDEMFRRMLINYGSPVLIVVSAYQLCIGDKTLQPIEELSKEIKTRLYKQAQQWLPDGNKEQLINLCKALWLKENI